MAKTSLNDAVRTFEANRPTYEEVARRLHGLLINLLDREELSTIQVEHRVKTVAGFEEKAVRKNYNDPLQQTTDLIGLRIVAYYLEDVEHIGELLAREFHIHEEYSTKKISELGIDQFGYRSDHYVVSINQSRSTLPEWSNYTEIKAEVQVRTALQHAWAAVDHKLNYKQVDDTPQELQRRMIRLSALFELADEEFSAIKAHRLKLLAERSQDVASGDLSAKLDDISLIAYLKNIQHHLISQLQILKVETMLPETTSSALAILRSLGISDLTDLQTIIGNDWSKNRNDISTINRHFHHAASQGVVSVHFAIIALAMVRRFTHVSDKENDLSRTLHAAAKELGYV